MRWDGVSSSITAAQSLGLSYRAISARIAAPVVSSVDGFLGVWFVGIDHKLMDFNDVIRLLGI